jgi:hypothetical protein
MVTSNGPDGLVDAVGQTVVVAVSVGADLEPDVRRHVDGHTVPPKTKIGLASSIFRRSSGNSENGFHGGK